MNQENKAEIYIKSLNSLFNLSTDELNKLIENKNIIESFLNPYNKNEIEKAISTFYEKIKNKNVYSKKIKKPNIKQILVILTETKKLSKDIIECQNCQVKKYKKNYYSQYLQYNNDFRNNLTNFQRIRLDEIMQDFIELQVVIIYSNSHCRSCNTCLIGLASEFSKIINEKNNKNYKEYLKSLDFKQEVENRGYIQFEIPDDIINYINRL